MKSFKVIYHIGSSLGLSTRVSSGVVVVDDVKISLLSKKGEKVADLTDISNLSLSMQNGLGRIIKFNLEGRTFFLAVVRFCIAGQFAMGNFVGTRKLKNILARYDQFAEEYL